VNAIAFIPGMTDALLAVGLKRRGARHKAGHDENCENQYRATTALGGAQNR
jgi:hypothetical protein